MCYFAHLIRNLPNMKYFVLVFLFQKGTAGCFLQTKQDFDRCSYFSISEIASFLEFVPKHAGFWEKRDNCVREMFLFFLLNKDPRWQSVCMPMMSTAPHVPVPNVPHYHKHLRTDRWWIPSAQFSVEQHLEAFAHSFTGPKKKALLLSPHFWDHFNLASYSICELDTKLEWVFIQFGRQTSLIWTLLQTRHTFP